MNYVNFDWSDKYLNVIHIGISEEISFYKLFNHFKFNYVIDPLMSCHYTISKLLKQLILNCTITTKYIYYLLAYLTRGASHSYYITKNIVR